MSCLELMAPPLSLHSTQALGKLALWGGPRRAVAALSQLAFFTSYNHHSIESSTIWLYPLNSG